LLARRHLLSTLSLPSSYLRCAVAVAALSLAGVSDPARAQESGALVRVDEVRMVPLNQSVPVIGRIVAQRLGVVAARIGGPVKTFRVEVGDRVEAGQVVAELDQAILMARRDIAAGGLAEARAERGKSAAEVTLAKLDFKRMEGLRKSAAFSQARYDDSRQQVVIAEAGLRQTDSAIASAKADLDLAEINLSDALIKAPYAGVVTERMTEAGAYVQGGDPMLRMIGDELLELEAEVPFQNLAGLEPGIEVGVTLDDGTRHTAVVRAILPSENPLTRTRTVRLVPNIGQTRRSLAHDQSVTIEVPIASERQVLTVHKDAIIVRRGQNMVYVAADGEAQEQPVVLGVAVGGRFEVRKGLEAGDKVVVRGNERLRPGDKLRIAGESS
jgi:RND family efflux transporter MFP subunit